MTSADAEPLGGRAVLPAVARCAIADGRADSRCTPGALNPAVAQAAISRTICHPGWTATVRPPVSYTNALKDRQKTSYGESAVPDAQLEEDHLIPLELGGSPRDPRNLWPEPRRRVGPAGRAAEDKDGEERALNRQVCRGAITLDQARRTIVAHWTH